jgi:hypothetical protein
VLCKLEYGKSAVHFQPVINTIFNPSVILLLQTNFSCTSQIYEDPHNIGIGSGTLSVSYLTGTGETSLGVKQLEREADHSPTTTAEAAP